MMTKHPGVMPLSAEEGNVTSRLWEHMSTGIQFDVFFWIYIFFGPSPLPFGGFTVLSLTRGPAGNRTTTGSLSATQEWRDTN